MTMPLCRRRSSPRSRNGQPAPPMLGSNPSRRRGCCRPPRWWADCDLAPGRRPWARRTPWPNAPKWDFAQAKRLEMGGCPGEMRRDARLRSRNGSERAKGLAPGRSPGQSAWRQGVAHGHGARPGETPRNANLPGRNVWKWVVARAKCQEMRDCAYERAPNGQRASRQGIRQGKVPCARASPMGMAHAPPKRPEMGFCPGEMPPPAGTARAKCLPPCDSRQNPIPGALRLKSQKGGAPRTTLPPRLDGPSRLLQYYRGVHGCFSFTVGCMVA